MTMPFGKYKGLLLEAVPNDYLEWLNRLPDLRQPLRDAVRTEVDRRRHGRRVPPNAVLAAHHVADELITAGLHALARRHHPDAGGNHDQMVTVTATADWLRAVVRGSV